MAQIRGTAGYHLGNQYGGPAQNDHTNDPSPLDAIREQTSKIEDFFDTIADPIKPYVQLVKSSSGCQLSREDLQADSMTLKRYLPAIGRFLIVVTFLEDALRIVTQWNDQLLYLRDYRHSKCRLEGQVVGHGQ